MSVLRLAEGLKIVFKGPSSELGVYLKVLVVFPKESLKYTGRLQGSRMQSKKFLRVKAPCKKAAIKNELTFKK